MNIEEARRLCASCGAAVAEQDYHRSRDGKCYCSTCREARRASSHAEPDLGTRRYIFYGTEVPRRDCHKNRYGEYVCRTCLGKGRRRSRQRSIERWLRHGVKRLWRLGLYVVPILVALALGYAILGKFIQ